MSTGSVWKDFLLYFEEKYKSAPIIFSVLRQLRFIELKNNTVFLSCNNQGVRMYIETKVPLLEEAFFNFSKIKASISLVVDLPHKNKDESPPLLSYEPTIEDICSKSGIHTRYRFDNFAVSGSNNVAFAASQSVAQDPGHSYNPLFLYGGVGVGKTHLAQAACRTILENNKNKRVCFCPGDQFTNELIEAIRERTTPKFRKKYRYLNVLAVDDIQFIAGKQTIQEEFFHTFNAVVSSGGQVILTSDRQPGEIKNLEDRLRSRFSGGLIVDMQSPDFELRSAIILIKAREKNIEIDIEVAKTIAEKIVDSRALEGALLSIYASILGKKEAIGFEDVEVYFQKAKNNNKKRFSHHDIVSSVCSYFGVRPSHIKSPSRLESLVFPRQIIMYLLRKELGLTFEEIALSLKRKDHTTIIHGYEKIKTLLMKNPNLKQQIDSITQSLLLST